MTVSPHIADEWQMALLFVSFIGLAGCALLAYIILPIWHERGGRVLFLLVGALGLTYTWHFVTDVYGVVYGDYFLSLGIGRAFTIRLLLALAIWSALFLLRGRS